MRKCGRCGRPLGSNSSCSNCRGAKLIEQWRKMSDEEHKRKLRQERKKAQAEKRAAEKRRRRRRGG
jgi:hypothetical protein